MAASFEMSLGVRDLNRMLRGAKVARHLLPASKTIAAKAPALMFSTPAAAEDEVPHQTLLPEAGQASWGLIGAFLDREPALPLTGLPAQGLLHRPFYSRIVRTRRCLLPLSAFYPTERQRLTPDQGAVMVAGVYDDHPRFGRTCAFLTHPANQRGIAGGQLPWVLDPVLWPVWLAHYAEFPEDLFEQMAALQAEKPSVSWALEILPPPEISPQLSFQFA